MLLRYEQNTKVHPLVLSYQTGSQELKIEVELQQIGEQSLENQYNSTLRLESNKWKLFFQEERSWEKTMHLEKKNEEEKKRILHIFSFCLLLWCCLDGKHFARARTMHQVLRRRPCKALDCRN